MINPMELSGKTVLVTGASSGIGKETAVLLSNLGAKIILTGRDKVRLEKTNEMLNGNSHQIEPFDLTDVDNISSWIKELVNKNEPLFAIVHCAGMQFTLPLHIINSKRIDELMRINVTAAFGLAKGFRQKGAYLSGGSIVFISSVMGLVGQPGVSCYAASKGAIDALTKSLALELSKENIRVNCVAPAHVKTEMAEKLQDKLTSEQFEAIQMMHPLGIGTPIDVAYAVAFLIGKTGRWITGTTLIVDGGYTAQ